MKHISYFTAAALFATSANGNAPDLNSKQMTRMAPYKVFVTTMHDTNGDFCCNLSDGRMGDGGDELKEQIIYGNGEQRFRVFVTRDIFGKDSHSDDSGLDVDHSYDKVIPEEGKWINIPPDRVLSAETPDVIACFKKNKECVAPPANILWLSTTGDVYCYYPAPRWTQSVTTKFARLEK